MSMKTADEHEQAHAALAQAQRASTTAAAAAHRSLRRSWLALGAALAIGFPGAEFITHLAHGRWSTWVVAAASFAMVAVAMQITGIVGRRSPVRADPRRRRTDVVTALVAIVATGVLA